MDIAEFLKDKLGEIVEKLKSDPKLLEKFKAQPDAALRDVTGIPLNDDQLKAVEKAVKAALETSGLADKLEGLKKLF